MYGIPYLIFIATLAILGCFSYRYRDRKDVVLYLNIIGVLVILFFVGLRGFVMFDWRIYYPEFQRITLEQETNAFGIDREPGWTVFCVICKAIYNDYHFMVLVHTIILTSLWANFFRKFTPNMLLAFALCFSFEGFVISFNLLRNSIAIGLFLNAIPYLIKRKPLQYFGLCALAISFHYSSFFFLPLYFFLHKKLNKYIFLVYLLFCAAVYTLNIPIFEKIAELVVGGNDVGEKVVEVYSGISHEIHISPIFFERLITGILLFCYYDKINKMRDGAPVFLNAFLIFISSAFLISDLSEISNRLSMLFVFSYWVLYWDILRCFNFRNNKILFAVFISLYCTFRTVAPMRNEIYQYENVLFDARSYNERAAMFDRLNFQDEE